jgi:Protein of unknown function (DUF3987)/Bifunctional DNA primase/polymerase, N-terminal
MTSADSMHTATDESQAHARTSRFNGHASLAQHALWHLSEGWSIIALPPGEKKPGGDGWQKHPINKGVAERMIDGQSNLGVLTGLLSGGLYDADMDHPWAVALAKVWLPKTARIHGRKSAPHRHYWYRDPESPGRATKHFQFTKHGETERTMYCELRGGNVESASQTVIPPSVYPKDEKHEKRERAVWAEEGEIAQVAYEDLLARVAKIAACVLVAEHWPGVGSRDDAAMALAGGLVRAHWQVDAVDEFVCMAARLAGDEEYKERAKAAATLKKQDAGEKTTGWPRLAKTLQDGDRVCSAICEWLNIRTERREESGTSAHDQQETTARVWPAPLSDAAYYGVLGQIVREIEPYIEADSAALLVNLLTTSGIAIGRKPYVQVGAVRHRCVLYTVTVGETGDNKQDSTAPIAAMAACKLDSADGDDWAISLTPWRPPTTDGLSTGEGLLWQIRDTHSEEKFNKKTSQVETVVTDAGISDKRLLAIEAEFARVLAVMYREGNTLSTTLRKLYDSPDVAQSSPKNNPVVVTGPHIGLIGQITPDELHRKLGEVELFNGFANRFVWVLTRRMVSRPSPDDYSAKAHEHAQKWRAAIEQARQIEAVTLDDEAVQLWATQYELLRCGGREGAPGRSGLARDVCARAHVHVLRIALIFALLDASKVITTHHLEAALAISDYCERCAAYLFGGEQADPIANVILDALRTRGALSRTQIAALFSRHTPSASVQAALDRLAEEGHIARRMEETSGRPIEMWGAVS